MNFGVSDIKVIMAMTTAIIVITFIFSGMGFVDEETDENNIPEFNITSERFDLVGQFPDSPGSPSNFDISWSEDLGSDSNNQIWLDGDTSDGTELVLLNNGNESEPELELLINNWEDGNSTTTTHTYTEIGDRNVYEVDGYELLATYTDYRNLGSSDAEFTINIEIREQPESDGGFLSRIPLVGGIVGVGEAGAAATLWIGGILFWTLGTAFEVILNLSYMLFEVMYFFVSLFHWLIASYTDVITHASSWAAIIVALPGILLSLMFAKLVFVGIKLLPTT